MQIELSIPMTEQILISTIGDSLTEGNAKEAVISDQPFFPNLYQSYTYNLLNEYGINCSIKNFGIGGEIINQICARFKKTVPAHIIVAMGGTNDVWRYADLAPGIEEEIGESLLDLYQKSVEGAFNLQKEYKDMDPPYVFICSIPPFGNVSTLPKNAQNSILHINAQIKSWIEEQNNDHILFCDVHKAMSNQERYMRKGLCIPDGVHFTKEGNKVCGVAIGRCILNLIR